ncbi:MAG: fasciclin domain-containing protein [Pseudomonadota bacterium]
MKIFGQISSTLAFLLSAFFALSTHAAHHESGHGDMMAKKQNIVEVAAGDANFSTLVAAVQAAGLVEVLSGDGPFTVFAPTNDAFAKLPAGTVEDLLKPENKSQLVAILKYHVVPGKVMAADVVNLSSATTVEGSDVAIAASDAGVTVDAANVVATDVAASNGVIHVIDSVILPAS